MGENVFDWTTILLNQPDEFIRFEHHISMDRYEAWQKLFTWDALQNEQLRYGQSFCKHFDIRDNILHYERDRGRADAYIRRNYLERP